jgi:hypothetical protein
MKYEFDTTTGEGSEIVTVVMVYEADEEGVYNENIEEVWFEGRNVTGLFTVEQYKEMEIEGSMRLHEYLIEEADHSASVDYDMRAI